MDWKYAQRSVNYLGQFALYGKWDIHSEQKSLHQTSKKQIRINSELQPPLQQKDVGALWEWLISKACFAQSHRNC